TNGRGPAQVPDLRAGGSGRLTRGGKTAGWALLTSVAEWRCDEPKKKGGPGEIGRLMEGTPADMALVLSVYEKSQIQALDRTQPGPLKKGRAGTMTRDSKRHGTTQLMAELAACSSPKGHKLAAAFDDADLVEIARPGPEIGRPAAAFKSHCRVALLPLGGASYDSTRRLLAWAQLGGGGAAQASDCRSRPGLRPAVRKDRDQNRRACRRFGMRSRRSPAPPRQTRWSCRRSAGDRSQCSFCRIGAPLCG